MKTKILFQAMACVFLMSVLLGSFLMIPGQTQTVLAKPLAAAFTTCAEQAQIPEAECNALVALYNRTNGVGWANRTGWLQTNIPCGWFGVTCGSGTNVTKLDLVDNHLSGSIPSQLGNLTKLTWLNLSTNHLSGPIPTQLGNLTKLSELYFGGNQLSGSIPTELGSLTKLVEMNLSYNQLSGSILVELGSLTQLKSLDLADNHLSGPIPSQLGNLTNLVYLDLSGNQLSGSIPPELGNLTLYYLYLYDNQLTGPIPAQLGKLSNLSSLTLQNNRLTGRIPKELGNLTNLYQLYLDHNQLSGEIPASIVNLTSLQYLTLSCGLASSNPAVISFIDALLPGWQNNLCPTVLSVARSDPNPTSSSSVNFTVTFSQVVTGVDTTDFSLKTSGVNGASVTSVSGSGATRTVKVNTGTGNGTIRLDVIDNDSIINTLATPLGGVNAGNGNFTGGQVYTVSKILTFTSIAAQDGCILESSETSSVGGAINSSATTFNLGDDAARKQYLGILSFNTGASLPDNAVITKVTLKVMKKDIIGGGDPVTMFKGFMVDIRKGFFGSTSALQAGDFQAAANQTYGPFMPAPVNNWYTIDLTGAKGYVNKLATASGLTQIRLRFNLDDNNNAIANYLRLYSGDAPAASRPQLIVTYYVP